MAHCGGVHVKADEEERRQMTLLSLFFIGLLVHTPNTLNRFFALPELN